MTTALKFSYEDWLRGWREWARTRKRGKMAQFIIEKLEEGNQAQWLDITSGVFELTEWHAIAKEWFGEKPRNSEEVDAPCMLRKGLPRAFPGLDEVKEKSRKEGTQYRSRVFQAPRALMNDVLLHITNSTGSSFIPNGPSSSTHMGYNHTPTFGSYSSSYNIVSANPIVSAMPPQVFATANQIGNVDMEIQPQTSHSSDYHHQLITNHDTQNGFIVQPQPSYTNDDIGRYVQRIVENGVDGPYHQQPPQQQPSNGPYSAYTSTASGPMLQVPKEEMSPPSCPPLYGTSPGSAHSPRISPEPSIMSSYSPSLQQQPNSVPMTGPDMIPSPNNVTATPTIPLESELMKVKVNPGSSPLEGGGQMVLLFYSPLPPGNKTVAFCSRKSQDFVYAQEAFQENMMALVCQIPEYPYPEEVELRVYNYNQIIARTMFTYYQQTMQMLPPSDMILQILSSQLQSHFTGNGIGGANGMANGTGDQMSGSGNYAGYIPNSMYQLLLGACRLGCEPLVHCLLSSPVMEHLSQDQIKEAQECACSNGHASLSELLSELSLLHDMIPVAAEPQQYICRGEGNAEPKETKHHVPAYYAVLDELDQGGESPQVRAETVLKQLLVAMDDNRKHETPTTRADPPSSLAVPDKPDSETNKDKDSSTTTTPVISITPNSSVTSLCVQLDSASVSPKRRLSSSAKLKRQSNSISDEDDEQRGRGGIVTTETKLPSSTEYHSRDSWSEVHDDVPDMITHRKKHPFTQQSDADSAIGMSFEEDISTSLSFEMNRRRSSLLLLDMYSSDNSLIVKLTPENGPEVVNELEWEGCFVVSDDFPAVSEKKIFYKGDKIIQIGDTEVSGMSSVEFSSLLQSEILKGTTVKVVPSVSSSSVQSLDMPSVPHYKRVTGEQTIFDNVRLKISHLTSLKAPGSERQVTLPLTNGQLPIKIIGGKVVGTFISDVRQDTSQLVSQGDEIIEINGRPLKGLSLYDANHLLQTSSEEINLTVVENKTKYMHSREQVEVDSLFLRSLVDYKPSNSRDMILKKGTIMRVVNTCSLPTHWVAWAIDEETGMETHLKKIIPPSTAKKQFGCDAYERIEPLDSAHLTHRPMCITGPNCRSVAKMIADNQDNRYSLCDSFQQLLSVCSKGNKHAIMGIEDPNSLELVTALRPMIFQTPITGISLPEQLKYSKLPINSYLSANTCDGLAEEVIREMHKSHDVPTWRPLGVL